MTNLDAAISVLNVSLAELDYVGEGCDGVKESMAQIEAAIRILEAAAKVDRDEALALLGQQLPFVGVKRTVSDDIYTLLAALPDGGKDGR